MLYPERGFERPITTLTHSHSRGTFVSWMPNGRELLVAHRDYPAQPQFAEKIDIITGVSQIAVASFGLRGRRLAVVAGNPRRQAEHRVAESAVQRVGLHRAARSIPGRPALIDPRGHGPTSPPLRAILVVSTPLERCGANPDWSLERAAPRAGRRVRRRTRRRAAKRGFRPFRPPHDKDPRSSCTYASFVY